MFSIFIQMPKTEEIFDKNEEEVEVVKPKPKRKLTEKQLANLAKGRAKMAEKRKAKNAELKKSEKEKKIIVKEEKKAVKEIKKEKTEAKKKRNKLLKEQEKEEAHFKALKEKEIEELRNKQLSDFQQLRTRYLTACKTTEDYTKLKAHLDSIDEDTVLDRNKLKATLLDMISNYAVKKPAPKKSVKIDDIPKEEENLKIDVDVKGNEKKYELIFS